ncbi:alpha/beta hydrolase [Marinilongibacter aquaticus]|uniref:alpha/beta hydrolase n=1 Tax=Marinilongibacter aquaticus TaxID=2975157 RepID=UPI0021BD892A|nr:alpha/beta hydrolase fold domain-containing protein [Marinilongibacter aquaticus]UBM58563.1 alpha/beta hydrolase [Marinilongibacter aquaticus]
MKRSLFLLISLGLLSSKVCFAQEKMLYKQIDTTKLYMEVFSPENPDAGQKYPAIVFFFGGGWVGGTTTQFEPHAKYFSEKGIVCILADYRVNKRQKTTPFESLKDAKSAMRFVRSHAQKLHIDPDKIVASGGSAGGHLAAATALISEYNEDTDDLSVSCKPNALILFNPVIDNGPGGYGFERIGEAYKDFSPLHNIRKGAPPTLFFLGTRDVLIPVETAQYYQTVMEKVGSRCDLYLYGGQPHGFFNLKNKAYYDMTVYRASQFLSSLGYLDE